METKNDLRRLLNGLAYDRLTTAGDYECFKSDADGYMYVMNRRTGRASRYNSEGQNGRRIPAATYTTARAALLERAAEREQPAQEQEAQEQATRPRRKRRIKWPDLLDAMTNYYADYRYQMNIGGQLIRGRIFKADRVDPEKLEGYNNVLLLKGRTQYAPEITFAAVFVGDKCFK